MKIICKDNFDREGPGFDDKLILSGLTSSKAERIAKILNEDLPDNGPDYYCVVPEMYKLKEFKP